MTMTKATILYVEDSEDIAYFVTTALSRAGYNVVRVKDGEQGIAYLRENTEPDIILLDIILPDMTGFEFLQHIKRAHDGVPVVFHTSLTDTQDAIKGLELGAYDYIRKDIKLEELCARLDSVLARTGINSPVIRLSEKTYINVASATMFCCGKAYDVRITDIKLLRYLLQHKNKMCSREQLAGVLWGENINADIYLSQAITRIRGIIKSDTDISIKSVRNSGITLVVKE